MLLDVRMTSLPGVSKLPSYEVVDKCAIILTVAPVEWYAAAWPPKE